jgi:choice-of-anchor B domain-containing protein
MKTTIHTLWFLLLLTGIRTNAQDAFRMRLLGNWNDTVLVAGQVNGFTTTKQYWSDFIGWTHPVSGKEFIIMGSVDSTYFFDVSDPANIRKCASYTGLNRVINRDYDVYKNYVYCVSDNGPSGALQIFDLQYLPDSVHLVLQDSSIVSRVHSLFVDSISQRLYFHAASKTFTQFGDSIVRYDMLILSLQDPENPVVIGELKDLRCGRVHEAYYRNDTAYCSCEYRGLHVFNVHQPDSILYIGGISPPYPYNGYNHTSWVNDEGTFLAFTDELPTGLPLKVFSIAPNKKDIDFATTFNSHPGATPHNLYWIGNKLWTSAYEDGMVLWDMSDPYNPRIEAFYDTYPQNANGVYSGFTGCWAVYPFFKSGNIAASDMHNGLFMLQYDQTLGLGNGRHPQLLSNIYPNPFTNELNMVLYSSVKEAADLKVYNLSGQLLLEKQIDLQEGENALKLEEVSELCNGMYLLRVITSQNIVQQPIVKH